MKRTINFLISVGFVILVLCIYPLAAQTPGINNNGVYSIKNVNSMKMMNVHNGLDITGTNIYQWTEDLTDDQQFKLVYDSSADAYRFYAMCSSEGTGKVIQIMSGGVNIDPGANILLTPPTYPTAQLWTITKLSNGNFVIKSKNNPNVAITSYGTSNGTASGNLITSPGNIYGDTYTGATNQQWIFEEVIYGTMDFEYMYTESDNIYISSSYGAPRTPEDHKGIDIVSTTSQSAIYGDNIYNVFQGTVNYVGRSLQSTAGYYVVIKTDKIDPVTSQNIYVRYLHLASYNSTLYEGDQISKGAFIGTTGNTGSVNPMPHQNDQCNTHNSENCLAPSVCNGIGTHLHLDIYNVNIGYGTPTYSQTINPQRFFPKVNFQGALSTK